MKLQTIEYQRSAVVLEYAPSIKTDQVSDEGNTVMDLAGLGKGLILLKLHCGLNLTLWHSKNAQRHRVSIDTRHALGYGPTIVS